MSVINRVLKDLDRQGGQGTPLVPGVQRVAYAQRSRAPLWLGLGIGLIALGGLAWWGWPQATPPRPLHPAPPAVPAPALPVAPAEPTLRLSQELSQPPAVESLRTDAKAHPAAGEVAEPAAPASPAAPARGAIPHAPRLDTHLPEPPPPKPQVVKEIKPPSPAEQTEELWRQASRLMELGQPHGAQGRLEQVLRLDPSHLQARQALVVLALESGRRAAAEALLREGMALHPAVIWFPRSLAQLHLQQGDHAQAAGLLKAGLDKGGEAADWGLYASILAKLGRGGETIAAYREALRRDPSQGIWWIGLGLALEQAGKRAEAADAYVRALQTRLSGELKDFAVKKAQELAGN